MEPTVQPPKDEDETKSALTEETQTPAAMPEETENVFSADRIGQVLGDPEMMKQVRALAMQLQQQSNAGEITLPQLSLGETKSEKNELPPKRPSGAFAADISLLKALRPFLDGARARKLDRVLQMMQLTDVAGIVQGLKQDPKA